MTLSAKKVAFAKNLLKINLQLSATTADRVSLITTREANGL
jgi:hypothetical protein